MNLNDYMLCASLKDVADFAKESVTSIGGEWASNFCMKVQFAVELLDKPEMKDAAEKAILWQETTCPKQLFFSHGQYLGPDGVQHIADELKEKPSSNRALASLISVKDILKKGDTPLPSFLVFQCQIDGPILFVTAMYRAMEVGTFFRINLEEIRMMALRVYESSRSVKQVALCVFVTRAYVKEGMIPLERCEIDLIPQIDLVTKHRTDLPRLVRDKGRQTTYPELDGLNNLLVLSKSELPAEVGIPGNGPDLQALLDRAIDDTMKLQTLRQKASHHSGITKLESDLAETLEKLAMMIELELKGGPV